MLLNVYVEWTALSVGLVAILSSFYFYPYKVWKLKRFDWSCWSGHDAYVVFIITINTLQVLVLMADSALCLYAIYHPDYVLVTVQKDWLLSPILRYSCFLYGMGLGTVPFLITYKYLKFSSSIITPAQNRVLVRITYAVLPFMNLIPTLTVMLTDTLKFDINYPYLRFIILTLGGVITMSYCTRLENELMQRVVKHYQEQYKHTVGSAAKAKDTFNKESLGGKSNDENSYVSHKSGTVTNSAAVKAERAVMVEKRIKIILAAQSMFGTGLCCCSILGEFIYRDYMSPIYKIILSLAALNQLSTLQLSRILYDGLIEINTSQVSSHSSSQTTNVYFTSMSEDASRNSTHRPISAL